MSLRLNMQESELQTLSSDHTEIESVENEETAIEGETYNNEQVSVRQTELYKLMKPLMIYFEIVGLFHVRAANEDVNHRLAKVSKNNSRSEKAILLCKIILRAIWDLYPLALIGFVFSLFAVFSINIAPNIPMMTFEAVSLEIFIFGILVLIIIILTSMYCFCENGTLLRVFHFYTLVSNDDEENKKHLDKIVVQSSRITLYLCVALNLVNGIAWHVFWHLAYTKQINTGCFGATFLMAANNNYINYCFIIAAGYVVLPPCTLIAGLFYTLSVMLSYKFQSLNDYLKEIITFEDNECYGDPKYRSDFSISPFIAKHHRIMKMLGFVNQLMGCKLLSYALIGIAMGCCLIYIVLFSCPTTGIKMIQVCWLLGAISVLSVILYPSIQVNIYAMMCWKRLNEIKMEHMSSQHGAQLALIINRLSFGHVIGLSASGFFTLTLQFVRWCLSSVVSYTILLMQLVPPSDDCIATTTNCSRFSDK